MKRVFLLAFFLAGACASPAFARDSKDLDAAPAGLTPATATLSHILKTYTAATGKRAAGAPDGSTETWTFTQAGENGTETLVRKGLDYYSRITTGPLVNEYGQFLGHRWHRDANGVVSAAQSVDYTSFEMLLFTDSFNDAADPKNDVKVLGEIAQPQPAYVLEVKKTGEKHPEWVYYDKNTGLVDEIVRIIDDRRATATYGDYRSTNGLTQPWHIHYTSGTASLDDDFKRTSLSVGKAVDARQFAMPASTYAFVSYSGHLSLPAKVVMTTWPVDVGHDRYHIVSGPTLVVRVNVNGRGLDFAVSAAQPHSLIDFDVAQELGLPSYGQVTHADGENVSYDTILPQADIGGLLLRKMAVRATPFHYHLGGEIKVVGMIGYDVLSAGVFKIDYDNKTLDLYPPKSFDGDQPVADSYTLPIEFDSGFPFFRGTIDSHESESILFDNDFESSFVFGSFTDRYPESVKDVVTGKEHAAAVIPFADAKGYGKDVQVWLGSIPDIEFGPARFANFQLIAADGAVRFGGHDVDAVMGGDLLQFYDIYLDYPHTRIILKPNKAFFKMFKVKEGS